MRRQLLLAVALALCSACARPVQSGPAPTRRAKETHRVVLPRAAHSPPHVARR